MKFNLNGYNIYHFLTALKKNYYEKSCIAFVGKDPLTYIQFYKEILSLAEHLAESGIRKRDRILIFAKGSPNWCIAFFASVCIGAVPVLYNHRIKKKHLIKTYQNNSCKIAFAGNEQKKILLEQSIISEKNIISLDNSKIEYQNSLKRGSEHDQKRINVEKICAEVLKDDYAGIFFSAGTTGVPKGCVFTHYSILSSVSEVADNYHFFNNNSKCFSLLSPAHIHGFMQGVMSVLYAGGTVFFTNNTGNRKRLYEDIARLKPGIIVAHNEFYDEVYNKRVIPVLTGQMFHHSLSRAFFTRKYLYRRMAQKIAKVVGKNIECLFVIGARFNPELEFFFIESNLPFSYGYTIAECASPLTLQHSDLYKTGAAGATLDEQQVMIVKPDQETGIGQIAVKSPGMMTGYKKRIGISRSGRAGSEWFLTGDRGLIGRNKYLYVSGREASGIKLIGDNTVFPEEIEDLFREEHYIKEVRIKIDHDILIAEIYPDYNFIKSRIKTSGHDAVDRQVFEVLDQLRKHINIKIPVMYEIKRIKIRRKPFDKNPYGSVIL